ncbi:hypothetical protein SAMN05660485_02549 [Blastococcus fimeti]|nr:hypothetical protein SAMN05660485_02549 [Blastococcus fimeti]
MPLRSVEAASRDDAIAAAREQFGPSARVVGVRRVRSGGVLGFFATERYVAEVAPEPAGAPGLPVAAPARPAGALTEDPDTGSLRAYGSPLAAASPARARPAPPRNGAAAWAAAAARSSSPAVRATPELVGASSGAGRRPGLPEAGLPEPADDDLVDELAGLLGVPAAPPERDVPAPAVPASRFGVAPATFPRTTRSTLPPAPPVEDDEPVAPSAPVSGAPSPFTAALARMVAGDRDVQHAVREALQTSDAARPGDEQDGTRAPQPEPEATSSSAVRSRQEEETVGDQVIAPPSPSVDERAEFAAWADESFADTAVPESSFPEPTFVEPTFVEPTFVDMSFLDEPAVIEPAVIEPAVIEPAAAEPVSREEAIAEMLRAALAEGHSDDALAGILRAVVAGDSPQDVLAESVEVAAEAPAVEMVPVLDEAPVVEVVAEVEAVVDEPAPAVSQFDLFSPVTPRAVVAPAAAAPEPSAPVQLWGEAPTPTPAPAPTFATTTPNADIWGRTAAAVPAATSLFGAPQVETPLVETPLVDTPLFDTPLFATPGIEVADDEAVAAEPVEAVTVEALTVEAEQILTEDTVAEDIAAETPVEETGTAPALEVAPLLARTASDPAPLPRAASMDATTVMPPLSLLPGSSSRGRGLPPVPPRSGRPPVPPSSGRGTAGTEGPASSVRTADLLATVTRLPVAPLMATPETPDMPELAEADGSGLLDSPVLPAAVPERPTRVRIAPPRTPAEVVSRLADLGVPADLLGTAFLADVEASGTYAALTRVLADRLPEPPELPTGAADVLFLVGPGVETLRAARSLAATLRLDPDRVQWATRGDLVGLAPEASRMSTIDGALRRRQDAASSGTVTIVAVDAPLRADAYWMAQMLAIWTPVAVWAVVEATRKPEDLEHWLDGLTRVDALVVQDTDLSADPAAVLDRLAAPVAVVDGLRATPHRWASVLCERLESAPA